MKLNRAAYHIIIILISTSVISLLCGFTQVHIMGENINNCIEGDGVSATKTIELSAFEKIKADGAFEIKVASGQKTHKATITCDKNLLQQIKAKVRDHTLHLTVDASICSKLPVKIKVQTSSINQIHSVGANDITSREINTRKMTVLVEGSGSVTLAGKITVLNSEVSGSSELQAEELTAEMVNITAKESATAVVYAEKSLQAVSSGASEVIFYGDPPEVKIEESEVGEVRPSGASQAFGPDFF